MVQKSVFFLPPFGWCYNPVVNNGSKKSPTKTNPSFALMKTIHSKSTSQKMTRWKKSPEKISCTPKTNMTSENPHVQQEIHHLQWWIFHGHVSFRGGNAWRQKSRTSKTHPVFDLQPFGFWNYCTPLGWKITSFSIRYIDSNGWNFPIVIR